MQKPLVIDLFCGLGGWSRAFLAEGWDAIGFDIERHDYGSGGYPGQLVLQDVCAIHGAKLAELKPACIVASSPCQEFSYRAMPWKRAKALPPPVLGINLFWQAFRIQQEIYEALGYWVPLIAENVRGAQKWVGPARANFGSFYFWGDIERVGNRIVRRGPAEFGQAALPVPSRAGGKANPDGNNHPQGSWFKIADSKNRGSKKGVKVPGMSWNGYGQPGYKAEAFSGNAAKKLASIKNDGGSWFAIGSPGKKVTGQNPDGRKVPGINLTDVGFNVAAARSYKQGVKQGGSGAAWFDKAVDERRKRTPEMIRQHIGNSRKAASAMIAMIPYPLAQYVARVYRPLGT